MTGGGHLRHDGLVEEATAPASLHAEIRPEAVVHEGRVHLHRVLGCLGDRRLVIVEEAGLWRLPELGLRSLVTEVVIV